MAKYIYGTIAEERPDLIKFLQNSDDGNRYHIGSAKKVYWICPECGMPAGLRSVNKVVSRGIRCMQCSDGVSRPEKIVMSALNQARIPFKPHQSFEWSQRRVYDIYLTDYNSIIEIHGVQHYFTTGFAALGGISLKEQQEIDEQKRKLALNNHIAKYFVINAVDTSANNIIQQLNVILESLIGYRPTIDVIACERDAMQNNVKIAADLWNSNVPMSQISAHLGVTNGTTINYLKDAARIGWCDYTPKKALRRGQKTSVNARKRKVRCVETGEVFESLADACRAHKISNASNIIRSCVNHHKHAGHIGDVKLSWRYVEVA